MDTKTTKKTTKITKIKVKPKPTLADERSNEAWNDVDSQLLDWD